MRRTAVAVVGIVLGLSPLLGACSDEKQCPDDQRIDRIDGPATVEDEEVTGDECAEDGLGPATPGEGATTVESAAEGFARDPGSEG